MATESPASRPLLPDRARGGVGGAVLGVALSMVACSAAFLVGFGVGRPVELCAGPADAHYLRGFRLRWQPGTTLRWARTEAQIQLPLEIRRAARVVLTGARPW